MSALVTNSTIGFVDVSLLTEIAFSKCRERLVLSVINLPLNDVKTPLAKIVER